MASAADTKRAKGLGSQSDLARLLGVAVPSVRQAIAEGRITRQADGWIHLANAAAEWRATSSGPRNGVGGAAAAAGEDGDTIAPDGGESMAAARTRKERALADKAEVDAAKARAEVVSIADARREWYAAGRTVRERLLAVPDHAGPALGLTAAQVTGLRDTIRRVLADLPEEMPQ